MNRVGERFLEHAPPATPPHDLYGLQSLRFLINFLPEFVLPGMLVTHSGVGKLINAGILFEPGCSPAVLTEMHPSMIMNIRFCCLRASRTTLF